MKNVTVLRSGLCAVLLLFLCACNNSDDNNSPNDDAGGGESPANLATLAITGADTAELGVELDLSYFAYREDFLGAEQFLSATSSGVTLDFVRAGFGELMIFAIDGSLYEVDVLNSVILNVFELGISMRINIDGNAWLYSSDCNGSCDSITFDASMRTVTFSDATVIPAVGGDVDSQATAPLTINGTLSWNANDENPNAAQNTQAPTPDGNSGNGLGLTLNDISGVWDTSEEMGINGRYNEMYTVITPGGSYISYDYLGDADEQGDNCYIKDAGTIVELGDSKFLINNLFRPTFVTEGDGLVAGSAQFRATAMLESDFTPLCN